MPVKSVSDQTCIKVKIRNLHTRDSFPILGSGEQGPFIQPCRCCADNSRRAPSGIGQGTPAQLPLEALGRGRGVGESFCPYINSKIII